MRILIATVGGSAPPVRRSIVQSRPQKVWFVCSDDVPGTHGSYTQIRGILDGLHCEGLPDRTPEHEVIKIRDFDNVSCCYRVCADLLARVRAENLDAEIIADFTGGTKSMSAGLAIAAAGRNDILLSIVSGERRDLVQVLQGTESVRIMLPAGILVDRYRDMIASAFKRFDYAAAAEVCRTVLATPGIESRRSADFQHWLTLATAYAAWDNFDHAGAWRNLTARRGLEVKRRAFLEAIIWSRRRLDPAYGEGLDGLAAKPKGHGYELVEDLLLNAERCAATTRFDDAVARLYRATELLMQLRLKLAHGILTGDLDTGLLPVGLRPEYEKMRNSRGRIELPLMRSLQLLIDLSETGSGEPLGQLLKNQKSRIMSFTDKRNVSIWAHGVSPVTQADYRTMENAVRELVETSFKTMAIKPYASPVQLPSSLPQPPSSEA